MTAKEIDQEAFDQVVRAYRKYHEIVTSSEMTDSTKQTYLVHAENFFRWLANDFEPGLQARSGRKKKNHLI